VHLVKEVLSGYAETGFSSDEIFSALETLPKQPEEFYMRILKQLDAGETRDIKVGIRLFQFVRFAACSPPVAEVAHAVAMPESQEVRYIASVEALERALVREVDKRIALRRQSLEIKRSEGAVGV
jgi:hypothetical protein